MNELLTLDGVEARAWSAHKKLSVRLFTHLNRELLTSVGISLPDFEVLEALGATAEGRLRAYELGIELQWEKSRLSHHLKRMESRGLVGRVVCESDRRGLWVTISTRGRSVLQEAAPVHDAQVREVFSNRLTPDELTRLAILTEKVVADLPGDGALCDS